ncbi:ATP-binding protein [Rufibacter glacialis]|uniref:histidine kinase n=1 Tax=Rufibacter glacialis TaxID=1259555 RepID=A0A5M8QF15_9BACT|nr:HAMP domain-containing sensor histidine kinase [Rufibacter glacialis]KAA6434625.1 PAS domain S-box protein [Rufibacter glacialis]GGK71132.1 hypothetical protein GCM10011405_19130 [Rufibacter glacialis]
MQSLNGSKEYSEEKYRQLVAENLTLRAENRSLRAEVSDALFKLEEQIAIETQYKESQSRFQTIFSKSKLGNKIIAPDLRIIQVNEALQTMLGYSEKELVGSRVIDFAHQDFAHHWLDLQDHLWSRKIPSFQIETCLIRKDGTVQWCQVTSILFRDQNSTLGYTIVEDIKERKELELKNKTLFEAQETILHMVAHDLKNPLNNIRLLGGFLKENLVNSGGAGSEETKENLTYTTMIAETCEKAFDIIKDLLFIGNMNAPVVLEPVDVSAFIASELSHLSVDAKKKGVAMAFHPSETPLFLLINREKFTRALENLISNAVKFTKPGGQVTISLKKENKKVLLQVRDNGIGIPEELQGSIFDKFTKANRQGTEGENTTGLGLFIVKQIVDLHKGKIWLESQEGIGTTFFLQLKEAQP